MLVVMGSGETAPSMVTVHQRALARAGAGPAVALDTPYGFQGNADDLSARTLQHFRERVGRELEVASFRSKESADADPLAFEQALDLLRGAAWAYAGPGSPSYALRTWAGTPVPELLARVAERGGVVTFSSAAALTLGVATVPVYEIYKVGEAPRWLDGLDLLGRLAGLRCALVPHWDNAEGGTHDTRFCYLGLGRLERLEAELPDGVGVLGVDEHTALQLDLAAGTATVAGRGTVAVRSGGVLVATLPAGSSSSLDDLRSMLAGGSATGTGVGAAALAAAGRATGIAGAGEAAAADAAPAAERDGLDDVPSASLGESARAAEVAFDAAMTARDAGAAVAAVLGLEAELDAWSADPTQSSERSAARATLRGMVTRLGRAAEEGLVDRRDVVGPFVDLLLQLRASARADKRWADADVVRDGLTAAGVEVRDTAAGAEWLLP